MSRNKSQVSDFKRFKTINEVSTAALLTVLIGAFLFVAYVFTMEYRYENDPFEGWGNYLYHYPQYLYGGVACVLVGLGCDIAAGILIMAGRFQSKWASKISNKLIFGLIGLLLVGPVMYYIFAGIGKKKARKEEQEQSSMPINNQYNGNPFNQQPNGYMNSNPYGQYNNQNQFGQYNNQNPYGQGNNQNPFGQYNNQNPFGQPNGNDNNGQN